MTWKTEGNRATLRDPVPEGAHRPGELRRLVQQPHSGRIPANVPDRAAAYASALDFFQLADLDAHVFVSPRTGGNPLGFTEEELEQVRGRGLPFSDQLSRVAEAIQIESIEEE